MKIINVIVISIFFLNVSYSQKTETGNWFMYFGNQKINKNINWHNEIQHRNYNFIGDFNQLILRTGIGFNLTEDNNNLLLGYGYINTEKYLANSNQKVNVNEHRIFQQFISKQNFGRFFVQHRYRVEERFLKNDFQLRLRYFLGINIPLNKKTLEKNTIYLSSYNEIFINSEKPLFDRNRLYGALGYFIHKNLKMEVGFMSQSLEDSNRNQFQIAIFNNFSI
jgi:intein/homing endonuclease